MSEKRPYKELPRHTQLCNDVYFRLQECNREYPIMRFIGKCTNVEKELQKCIQSNLQRKRETNKRLVPKPVPEPTGTNQAL